jgi:hypothetical protein
VTKYCSRECQLYDWKSHKQVCPYLPIFLEKNIADEAVVLLKSLRIILAQQAAKSSGGGAAAGAEDYCKVETVGGKVSVVRCGCEHIDRMSLGGGYFTERTVRTIDAVCEIVECSVELASNTYLKFNSNNFGITDDMMNCIGVGVFPQAAILNHSCTPNAYLRYRTRDKQYTDAGIWSPVCEVVAMVDVEAGTELCHSYLDLTYSYPDRVDILNSNYGFRCTCERCLFSFRRLDLTAEGTGLIADGRDADRRRLLSCIGVTGSKDDGDLKERDPLQVDLLTLLDYIDDIKLTRKNDRAYLVGLSEDLVVGFKDEGEWAQERPRVLERLARYDAAMLQQASEEVTASTGKSEGDMADEYERSIIGEMDIVRSFVSCEFSSEFYRLNTRLFDHYILTGNVERAYVFCKRILAYLSVALMTVSFSPLLGLHYYTLGDLASSLDNMEGGKEKGKEKERVVYHRRSHENLVYTHGDNSDLVQILNEALSDEIGTTSSGGGGGGGDGGVASVFKPLNKKTLQSAFP